MTHDLKNALHRISLASQNSMSSKEECGRIAREALAAPDDTFTRRQVEVMLRVALTDRTDEWTSKSVDERVATLLSMFTTEKP